MNLFLTSVLYIIVIIHIAFVSVKANPSDSENESEQLFVRKDSDSRNSGRSNSGRRPSQSSNKLIRHSSYRRVFRRRPSLSSHHCSLSIKLYLNGRKIRSSIYDTVWCDFSYENYWVNSYLIYRQKIIQHINLIRLVYGACPLKESAELDQLAQDYSQYKATRRPFRKNLIKDCGVSKLLLHYSELTGIVSTLYSERSHYSFLLNSGKGIADGFTQLVWRSTTSVGIGIARKKDLFHVVLLFYPRGNILGQYGKNVLKKQISWKRTMLRGE